jgi:hypothetical protein
MGELKRMQQKETCRGGGGYERLNRFAEQDILKMASVHVIHFVDGNKAIMIMLLICLGLF